MDGEIIPKLALTLQEKDTFLISVGTPFQDEATWFRKGTKKCNESKASGLTVSSLDAGF